MLSLSLVMACASPLPTFEEVRPAEELYQQGVEILEGRLVLGLLRRIDHAAAIETFQTIIDNYPYSDYAVLAELKIADAYFDNRKYEEALSYYRDFGELHPRQEQVAYTVFRSAICHQRRIGSHRRDQTATRDALIYLDRLLTRYPHSAYAERAETMWRDLRLRLALQIQGIGDFYMARGEYEAAAERYRSLLNEYPGLGLDPETLYKLGLCYREMNREDEAAAIFQSIVRYYDNSAVAEDAEDQMDRAEDWSPQEP